MKDLFYMRFSSVVSAVSLGVWVNSVWAATSFLWVFEFVIALVEYWKEKK